MKPILFFMLAGMAFGHAQSFESGQVAPAPRDSTSHAVDGAITLDQLLNPSTKTSIDVNGIRAQMIGDAGWTVGFRAGMASRARTHTKCLEARSSALDSLFQFSTLVRPDGTVPPVIVEASDVASLSTDQFRFAGHVYRIEKEERFVSVPPTWRSYLFAGLLGKGKVELPVPEARPHDDKELAIWRDAVRSGWVRGEKEADAVLNANFSRLTRDYSGMMLYSPLLATGMISSTKVAESSQTVTGDARQLVLDDTLRRLTAKAMFETNAEKWVSVIAGGERAATAENERGSGGVSGVHADR